MKPVSSVELSCHPIVIVDPDEGVAVMFVGVAGIEGMTGGFGSTVVAHEIFEYDENADFFPVTRAARMR